MISDREKTRRQILGNAIQRARWDSVSIQRSMNCAEATRNGLPLDHHSQHCIGVTDPDKCVCECHDGPTA